MMRLVCKLLACLLAMLPASSALGRVDVKVDFGWNGGYRAGRWAPVYLTMADDMAQPARNVLVRITAPHNKIFALNIYPPATIRPDPTTIVLYVPLTSQLDQTVAVILDPASGKILGEAPFEVPFGNSPNRRPYVAASYGGEILLGVSGV